MTLDTRALGKHHFAFLRAWLQGLDLKAAWARYLAFGSSSDDLRHIEHQRAALLAQVLHAGRQRALAEPGLPGLAQACELLAHLPAPTPSPALPSLDEFITAQGVDPDQFSQAEWLAEYRAHHGLDQAGGALPAAAHGARSGDPSRTEAHDGTDIDAMPGSPASRAAQPADEAPLRQRLRALALLEGLLARSPHPQDRLALWFAPPTLRRLHAVGASHLGALCDHIDLHGHGWFKPVRGLGATRAQAVLAWLAPLAQAWGRPLRETALQAPQRLGRLRAHTLRQLVATPRFAIVPLAQLAVPAALAGGTAAPGLFATRMANSLGAGDDLQALRAWLAGHAESPATHRAYAKEVERFYLWCLHARRKPLSSVDAVDCQAYRQFLSDVPPAWAQAAALPRDDPSWRPFRGALKPASQRYALVVVQALFDGLREANYLVANPMAAVRKRARLPEPALDIGRSFSDAEWAFLVGRLAQEEAAALARPHRQTHPRTPPKTLAGTPTHLAGGGTATGSAWALPPPGAEQRRLRLVLALLCATGLRLSELVAASSASLTRVPVDGETGEDAWAWLITVVGKGRKLRQVPLPEGLQVLIDAHHADAAAIAPLPSPAPLVCTLWPGVSRWQETDTAPLVSPVAAAGALDAGVALHRGVLAPGRALGANGLYRMLKRWFERAAREASAVDGLDGARLRAASTHWLRHTFGRQGAAAGVPVEVLQQAFGHASLNTTTTYLSTERSRMVRELREARRRRPPVAW